MSHVPFVQFVQSGIAQTAQMEHGSWAVCSKVALHKLHKWNMAHGQFVPKWHCTNCTNGTWLMGSLFQSGIARKPTLISSKKITPPPTFGPLSSTGSENCE